MVQPAPFDTTQPFLVILGWSGSPFPHQPELGEAECGHVSACGAHDVAQSTLQGQSRSGAPNLVNIWTHLADSGPTLAGSGPRVANPKQDWPNLAELSPKLAEIGLSLFGRYLLPMCWQARDVGRLCSQAPLDGLHLGDNWAEFGPKFVEPGPLLSKMSASMS